VRDLSSDPYKILGIQRDATQREVKQAYRRLAMKFHPEHNPEKPETEACFKQIQQAIGNISLDFQMSYFYSSPYDELGKVICWNF